MRRTGSSHWGVGDSRRVGIACEAGWGWPTGDCPDVGGSGLWAGIGRIDLVLAALGRAQSRIPALPLWNLAG